MEETTMFAAIKELRKLKQEEVLIVDQESDGMMDELMEMLQASGYTIHEVSKEELTDLTED